MAIPKIHASVSLPTQPQLLLLPHLVSQPSASARTRLAAHLIDLGIVQGFSAAFAKLLAYSIVAFFASEIADAGPSADSLFFDAMDYSYGMLFSGSFVFLSIVYFIGLPCFTGKTFGLGLLGLKIQPRNRAADHIDFHLRRYVGCALVYMSCGILLLAGSQSGLFQDSFSNTEIVES
jgi:hypothetical protein